MSLINPSYTIALLTGTACQLGCKSCPAGRKEEQVPGTMRPEVLDRALTHIGSQVKITSVVCHNYNEPSLIPWLWELIYTVKKHNTLVFLSTNLSCTPKMFDNLRRALAFGVDNFIISCSGFTQKTYEISHKGGDIELVKRLMREVARIKRKDTPVRVGWHQYRYNTHEEPLMREYAESLGFTFTPYACSLLPLEVAIEAMESGVPHPGAEDLITPMPEAKKLCFERRHFRCVYQDSWLVLEPDGKLRFCSPRSMDRTEQFKPYAWDIDVEKYRQERYKNPTCIACKAKGYHVYGNQQYHRKVHSLTRNLEDAYKLMGLGGKFPWLSKLINSRMYVRPKGGRK